MEKTEKDRGYSNNYESARDKKTSLKNLIPHQKQKKTGSKY